MAAFHEQSQTPYIAWCDRGIVAEQNPIHDGILGRISLKHLNRKSALFYSIDSTQSAAPLAAGQRTAAGERARILLAIEKKRLTCRSQRLPIVRLVAIVRVEAVKGARAVLVES
jgi:hypothetical protein